MKSPGAFRRALSPFLASLLLLSSVSMALAGDPIPGDGKSQAEVRSHEKSGDAAKSDPAPTPGLAEQFCPLKYPVYFFWFVFVAITTSVFFVGDMTTGSSLGLLKRFIPWVKEKTRDLDRFFKGRGCSMGNSPMTPGSA